MRLYKNLKEKQRNWDLENRILPKVHWLQTTSVKCPVNPLTLACWGEPPHPVGNFWTRFFSKPRTHLSKAQREENTFFSSSRASLSISYWPLPTNSKIFFSFLNFPNQDLFLVDYPTNRMLEGHYPLPWKKPCQPFLSLFSSLERREDGDWMYLLPYYGLSQFLISKYWTRARVCMSWERIITFGIDESKSWSGWKI